MSFRKSYVLVRCPDCGFYGLAVHGHKTRLCVSCGKTIKIDYLHARKVDDLREAQRLLGESNAKLHEANPSRGELAKIDTSGSRGRVDPTTKSTKGLLRRFEEGVLARYMGREVELNEFLADCESQGVSAEYARKFLNQLVENGHVYSPRKDRIRFLSSTT